ncbi:MAG TPA: hypothetical protein VI033_05695 [Candidatus Nitrosopolaris sp.]
MTKCDKGMALAYVAYKLFSLEGKGAQKIMYLGDSENDNPAFVKADVSIGMWSHDRLNPKLLCTDSLNLMSYRRFTRD